MRHKFIIERIAGGVVAQTYRPKSPGRRAAMLQGRALAGKMCMNISWNRVLNAVVVKNLTTGHTVASYMPDRYGRAQKL